MKEKSPSEPKKESETSFETAFTRLEEILEKMNGGDTTLDESLKLFEEADKLIGNCSKRLNEAERRVETLIKNRNGELVLEGDDRPAATAFNPPSRSSSL